MKKENILQTVLKGNCPQCHQESMYKKQNPYYVLHLFEMYERCSNCGIKYKIEPSFFFGAMYISYGIGVAIGIVTFVICRLIFDLSLINCFIIIVILLMILFPISGRLSRNIWITFFISYNPDFVTNTQFFKPSKN